MQNKRLMIVDDHAGMRQLLRELLGGLAAAVCECASGEEAIAQCEKFRPDFVTMDFNLQTMNGLDATRQILTLQQSAEVVIVTASDSIALRRAAIRAGASGCFAKDNLDALQRHFENQSHLPGHA